MKKRFEELLFYAFLFLFPLQTRIILWQKDWAFSEWRSAAVYGSDILFFSLIAVWLSGKPKIDFNRRGYRALAVFVALALLSCAWSGDTAVSAYQFFRLLQGVLLFVYLGQYARKRFNTVMSLSVFVAGGAGQAVVAIGQYLLQHDLGLRWLGETVLLPQMRGVAVFHNFSGDKIMRAYGLLPHPNVLAFYLTVAMLASWLLIFLSSGYRRLGASVSYALMLPAFWFTYSRTAYFAFAVSGAVFLYLASKEKLHLIGIKKILVITSAVAAVLLCFFWQDLAARVMISSQEEAVQFRLFFNRQALSSGGGPDINWFGVGWGSFVSWFIENRPGLPPYMYQPVHNIYLLVYAETGIAGLIALVIFIFSLLKNSFRDSDITRKAVIILAGALLFTGLFDHFPATLQQGRLLFWGILAFL